jgi:hypothetical protein
MKEEKRCTVLLSKHIEGGVEIGPSIQSPLAITQSPCILLTITLIRRRTVTETERYTERFLSNV